jgi:hypothetical protein
MRKLSGFILSQFLFLSLAFSAVALDDDLLTATDQPESTGEVSAKIESSLPNISGEDAAELAEAVYLMQELEREIYLTNEIIRLREEGREYEEIQRMIEEELERLEQAMPIEKVLESVWIVEEVLEEAAPDEIIVAKQISEEAEVSLPREDRSLLTEIEKKDKTRRIKLTPASAPGREIQLYTKEELEEYRSSIIIEKEQSVLISVIGLRRFITTDPKKLSVDRVDDKIRVTGMTLGKSFLHIWDSEGRRTVKVTVIQKGYETFVKAKRRAREAAKMESFKVRYSFDRYRINSKSKSAARSYHYTEWFHRLGITGETPWGRTTSRFQYEGNESGGGTELLRDLTAWDFNLIGDDIELSLGDTGTRFSDITLPSTGFQGVRFKNPDGKKINYNLIWGVRGNRMWGYRVESWENESYFAGARGEIRPADFIHFNATLMRCLENGEEVGEYLYASGFGLNFLDNAIIIEYEAARAKREDTDIHNHAYQLDTTLNLRDFNLLLEGTYRDIDPSFMLVTGTSPSHVGELGYYFNADYHPFDYLRLTGEYNVFRNRYSFNPTETQRYNKDWRGTVDFDIGRDTSFRYATWGRVREGDSSPSRGYGSSYSVSHNYKMPLINRRASVNLSYAPSEYKNLGDASPNYTERRYSAGMRLNVIKNLYYDIQNNWHYRKMLNRDSHESGTIKKLSTGLNYSSRILDTPFYGSFRLRLQKEYDTMDNLPLSSGEDSILWGGEIKYRPSGDFETYIRVNRQEYRGTLDHGQNRRETRIYGGGSYLLDTTLRWGEGGSVRGFVFTDLNGNGRKDPEEEGISGADVYAGDLHSTVTDTDGRFEFRRIKGLEISVMFDPAILPSGYRSTTPNPQTVALERGMVSMADFGVMAVAEISGRVFNDVNMNGVFDNGDKGAGNALIALGYGPMVQTMNSGHYRFENVKTGEVVLNLDTMTLPSSLLSIQKVKRTFEVEEGKYYKEDFPLYALRTIVGTIFVDKNGNGLFDADEEGAADVVLRCADSATLTDNQGRYFLKKLPGGVQEVIVDVESIPSGYELSVEPSRTIELLPEGEIMENVDFALRKK